MSENIAAATQPNGGRIYDYFLGGHHNFEVDRQTAEVLAKLMPFAPKAARLQRWCLKDIAEELTGKRGFDIVIDFASGLPTEDHIHQRVAPGTTVIYSDYDPVTVEYAREILKGIPDVYCFQADARHPEELLTQPRVLDVLHGRRDIAFVHWGFASFATDEDIAHIARYLYDWSGPKSCWAFQAQGAGGDPNNPANIQVRKIYEQMHTPYYLRPLENFQKALQPWHPDERGFVALLDWHGFDRSIMTAEDIADFGPGGIGYGAYLVK